MSIGTLNSIPETTHGFKTKLLFFIERIERLRAALKKEARSMEILDVGCGNGLQITFPLGGEGYSVLGVDMHEPSISYAKKHNQFAHVQFQLGESTRLRDTVGQRTFDVVILSDILEHVKDPGQLLADARSLLKPQGIILISIPNGYGPFEVENYVLRKLGIIRAGRFLKNAIAQLRGQNQVPYNVESGHIQFFSRAAFDAVVRTASLAISEFRKGCFLGGSVTNALISPFSPLVRANVRIGRYLPSCMCSVWYFECVTASKAQ